jgi:TRAP transporter TAXI family solute receptor
VAVLVTVLVAGTTVAQEPRFIRIGTGPTGGTYFPIGGLIANAISNPPGSVDCELGGSCGVPGLIATAVSTAGAVDNVAALAERRVDLALVQADVAHDAHSGAGRFTGSRRVEEVRTVANLFMEYVHVVVRRDAGIESIGDLKRKRVSMGAAESGTAVAALLVLKAYGLGPKNLSAVFEDLDRSIDLLIAGKIDAYFMVGGYPLPAIVHTAEATAITLLPIDGSEAEALVKDRPFFTAGKIPAGLYTGVGETVTIGVGAQLITHAGTDPDLIYGITRALWHPRNRKILESDHPNARQIRLSAALRGIAVPLHPGAARYYAEAGLKPDGTL